MAHVKITKGFWFDRLEVNATRAIFHQWEQLEASGCIENFRIAAGEEQGFREGWFFADSDAYKWLDAAAHILASHLDQRLLTLVDGLIALIGRAQTPDGYIFTYNQIHFPGTRWHNLQIEHELYCHGHLIEAGVSHYEGTGRMDLLEIARKAADRIVADFKGKGPAYTPGHEEIELALLRLHQVVEEDSDYLELAHQFIEQRGRIPNFTRSLLEQNASANRRKKIIREQKEAYLAAHPDFKPFQLPPDNVTPKPWNARLRWYAATLSGKYLQQHAPVRDQTIPVGHAVRFGYFETAVAMLARLSGDRSLLPAMEHAWERMVTRRMYLTGGLGAAPGLEGFGRDNELNPEYAYAETCAAIASLYWNWEMAQLTGEAKYSDLFEWQLYNAAAVGMGLDGKTYLYNNPLACMGGVDRQAWYAVPCCPSNLSRTFAGLARYIFSTAPSVLRIHQYISSTVKNAEIQGVHGYANSIGFSMQSSLPWEGQVRIKITEIELSGSGLEAPFAVELRVPSWVDGMAVTINGKPACVEIPAKEERKEPAASGYDPGPAVFARLCQPWAVGDEIEIEFGMPLCVRKAEPKVKGHRGKIAVTRGPLVYCLESVDHPGLDIFATRIDPTSLVTLWDDGLLRGMMKIAGKTVEGENVTFIPYFLWGNRGSSKMTVWVKE